MSNVPTTMTSSEADEYFKNLGIEYSFGCLQEKKPEFCHLYGQFLEQIRQKYADAFNIYKKNCEDHKHPGSCLRYGMYLVAGKECESNIEAAIKPFKCACDADMSVGCHLLSLAYYNSGKSGFEPKVEEYMRRACELEDGKSCWLLSTWYLGPVEGVGLIGGKTVTGKNIEIATRNPELALKYGIRSCELGMAQACVNVSRMYGIGDGVEQDEKKAAEFKNRALDLTGVKKRNNKLFNFLKSE